MPDNILIVEDKIIVARDLQQMVEGYGYNVIAIASNGSEAFDGHKDEARPYFNGYYARRRRRRDRHRT